MPLAREVLVELAPGVVGRPRRAQHAHAEQPGEPLLLGRGVGVVLDLAEPVVGDGHEQAADGRVDHVVGDVEQPLGGGGVAEAAVELAGDGHVDSFLRRRRTPDDAACRAASGDEPSAAPMSS